MKGYLRDSEALAASVVINSHVQPAAEEVLVHLHQHSASADAYNIMPCNQPLREAQLALDLATSCL